MMTPDSPQSAPLHVTSGDIAGALIEKSGIGGRVLVWHDILYDGPRRAPGWPDAATLDARARFLEEVTGGGLERASILATLTEQYEALSRAGEASRIVLWFDACLFDQAMLAHVLACLDHVGVRRAELLCVDRFPGIEPFHGLGQLTPEEIASLQGSELPVTPEQFAYAKRVDAAFATKDLEGLGKISREGAAPLPWMPAACARWLLETPDPRTGLGRLETLTLNAVRAGASTPEALFRVVGEADGAPRYWGDITLWAKVNALAERGPPLVRIEGPARRLPQWGEAAKLAGFTITPVSS